MIVLPTPLSSAILYAVLTTSFRPTTASDLPLAGSATDKWDQTSWSIGVDGVMGGKSKGYASYSDPNDTMTFYGTINTNGGGFANVGRRFRPSLDLTPYAGVVVEMEAERWVGSSSGGEGEKPFGFHLQMGDRAGYYGFSSAFAVPLSEEDRVGTGVYLPLDSFDRSSRMGYQCKSCTLDTTSIDEMEIYALFQEGPFRVNVKSITAVTDPRSFVAPTIGFGSTEDITALIEATVTSGSKVYDYGYREICIAIYWSTLNTILEATGVSNAVKEVACVGLKRVDYNGEKVENAWTLRYTLDAVLADVQGVERKSNSPAWIPELNTVGVLGEDCVGYTSIPSRYVGTGLFDNDLANSAPTSADNTDENADETSDETVDETSDETFNALADKSSSTADDIPSSAVGSRCLLRSSLALSGFMGLVYILW